MRGSQAESGPATGRDGGGDLLQSKVWGCLLGGAIGNAMGSIVENWSYERIEEVYGRIEEPLSLERIQTEDDNRIALLFCDAYLKHRRNLTPEDLAGVWLEEFDPGTDFFWCMRNALELLRRGVSPRQTGIYNVNTGSALMAIAPVGVFNAGEPDRAYSDALDLAYMYQPKPDAHCAAAFAAGVAEALVPGATVDSVVEEIVGHSLDEDLAYWDAERKLSNTRRALEVALAVAGDHGADWWGARRDLYDALCQWHPIDPTEVLSLSVALFKMTGGEYVGGVIAGTNIGRDADTIANLVGTLAGCLRGVESIPEEWREGVREINAALYLRFKTTADGLVALLRDKWAAHEKLLALFRSPQV
ncbi:MAG: ADP-ribosylglycohydrolase family protein [Promethearchaeota archaeon]